MREVLRSLEADGLVRRVHGVGTFVALNGPVVRTALDLDIGVTEAVAAARADLDIEIVRAITEPAPRGPASALELPVGGLVLSVERIIRVNGAPAVHGLDMIPVEVTHGRSSIYDGGSVYRFLEQELHIDLIGGDAEVTAVGATPQLARGLGIARGTPLLRLEQVEKSVAGRPVLFSREHYVPGVFSLMVRRLRRQPAGLTAAANQGSSQSLAPS